MLNSTIFNVKCACSKAINKLFVSACAMVITLAVSAGANAVPVQYPLFISNPVKPIMMLNMSRDHQLFFKLYDDYSDNWHTSENDPNYGKLEPDGLADTTYFHKNRYYGYFDPDKCYTYKDGLFSPSSYVDKNTRYCNKEWSGNLLNWATMTRLDAVRKILYGGKRSTDEDSKTVLERAYIPEDAHAFAKYYNGKDIDKLTPFSLTGGNSTEDSGITFCNATSPASAPSFWSHDVSANASVPPLMKVAKGNHSLWASNEGYQCRWGSGQNDNDKVITGMNAYPSSPKQADHSTVNSDYVVRVSVCEAKFITPTKTENPSELALENEEGCVAYSPGKFKPIGLLQEFGEKGTINFGLMTGSYGKNKSGGVLRKNVGSITDEVDLNNGIFKDSVKKGTGNTIIGALERLTIYGYSHTDGNYNNASVDNCSWGLKAEDFTDGRCRSWGNPQSEIYLESLRYLAGFGANLNFAEETNDPKAISGLTSAAWAKPVTKDNYCAPLNILQFNASTSSYDTDLLGGASDIGLSDLNKKTDDIGASEGITTGSYFVGISTGAETQAEGKELCTPKAIKNLSSAKGTCPDAPRLGGGFGIAGLAYHARETGISMKDGNAHLPKDANNNVVKTTVADPAKFLTPKVHTYGVALSPVVPKVEIPVPGYDLSTNKKIVLLPACRSTTTGGNCAIVDFKVIAQNHTGNTYTGSLYVNWEDSEQGGDYDQDMWGLINYTVTNTDVYVDTRVVAQAAGHVLGFGYVIGGTNKDGFHVQSGINNFSFAYAGSVCTSATPCTCRSSWQGRCDVPPDPTPKFQRKDFKVQENASAAAAVKSLEQPLYYAAKWGGYKEDELPTASSKPQTYYFATDPRQLAKSMRDAFTDIAERTGSSSGVATNSTSLNGSSYLYQAVFNSDNWHGGLNGFKFDADGKLVRDATSKKPKVAISTDKTQPVPRDRKIFTFNGSETVVFNWANLTDTQKNLLRSPTDPAGDYANALRRFDWLTGRDTYEKGADALRSRIINKQGDRNIIADIVNSTPVYVGETNFRYHRLTLGGSDYRKYLLDKTKRKAKVVVGANDGKLHVFDANDELKELYVYVPNLVFPKLRFVTAPNYGRPTNPHQYLLDGPLTVGDVYDKDEEKWRTIVVGTMGGGGRGVFAVDVSSDTKPEVLFEISEADFPELGYVLGKPIIAPLKNGRWGVIFGNGSDSGDSNRSVATQSHLFVVDIFDPKNKTKVISTGAGRGLSAPAVLPDVNGVATAAYAGDLNGNMWKFDLSDMSIDSEKLSEKVKKIFHATTSDSKEQPITAAPTLGINSASGGKIIVYFGTGKYFEANDQSVLAGDPHHSFYAVNDKGSTVVRKRLAPKTLDSKTRIITGAAILWETSSTTDTTGAYDGWFMDFGAGERVITKSLLIADKLVFPTVVPDASQCAYGGHSWIVEVPAVGNKFVNYKVLKDPPKQHELTTAAIGFGVTETAAAILLGDTQGTPDDLAAEEAPKSTGRQSWRELD